jgi:hypothetical protein
MVILDLIGSKSRGIRTFFKNPPFRFSDGRRSWGSLPPELTAPPVTTVLLVNAVVLPPPLLDRLDVNMPDDGQRALFPGATPRLSAARSNTLD